MKRSFQVKAFAKLQILICIFALWFGAIRSPAVDVQFFFTDYTSAQQGLKRFTLYPIQVSLTNGPNLVTRDRISAVVGTNGSIIVSNVLCGGYRSEFVGTSIVSTNFFNFPCTNILVNAKDYLTNFTNGNSAFTFVQQITSSNGTISIFPASGAGIVDLAISSSGTGIVSSVGLSMPPEFGVANSPVTSSGTIVVTKMSQSQNLFWASPNGSSGVMTPRRVAIGDLPAGYNSNFLQSVVYDVHQFGALGDGVTDDTLAIQAGINFVVTNGGGTLFFPPGTYIVNGPFQDTSHANGQLLVPVPPHPATDMTTLRLLGAVFPGQGMADVTDGNSNLLNVATIKSTVTQANGSQSILSTYYAASGGFTPVTLDIENLVFNAGQNPKMSGLNLNNFSSVRLRGVIVWSGFAPVVSGQPTHPGATAISFPTNNNSAFSVVYDTDVSGFYTGFQFNEHVSGDNISAWYCVQAINVTFGYHASHIDRALIVQCPYGVVVTGAGSLVIDEYDVEHSAGGWNAPVYDLDDVSNVGRGSISWASILASSGISHTFLVHSATGWLTQEIGSPFKTPLVQTLELDVNSVILTNEQRIAQTAWVNGPTGSYDASVPLQTYSIAAASAISSIANARTSTWANYSEFDVTNGTAGDLTLYWTAAGITTPDGARSYVCTNHTATTFKVETSSQGVWVHKIPHF